MKEHATEERDTLKRGGDLRLASRAGIVGLCSFLSAAAQTLSLQPGFEVMRTGSNVPVAAVSRPFEISTNKPSARLGFTFGFGTDETNAPSKFFDSFSITLAGQDGEGSVVLVTLDTTGPQWVPESDGLLLNDAVVARSDVAFDRGNGNFAVTYAYSVSLSIPAEVMGGTASLLFDLFDNRNGIDSLAYFGEIDLFSGIDRPPRPGLMSAATPLGPFAFEDDFETNQLTKSVSLPHVPRKRFYRLQADGPCRFLPVAIDGNDFVFPYEFLTPMVALEKTTDLKRWVPVPDALVAIPEKIISAPWDPTARFYRLTGNLRTHIVSFERQENTLLIRFDFQPAGLALLSSAQPDGPFALEQNARHDALGQSLRIPRRGSMLFFRFSPDDARDLTDIRVEGDRVICGYRVRESNGTNITQRSNFPL